MRRVGNLYEKICTLNNLQDAFLKAVKVKSTRREVVAFRQNFNENINTLRRGLLFESSTIGEYRFFMVYDPKERLICAASFPERVLHHAIMNICEPYLDGYAIFDSYACRQGKGSHKALARAQKFSRNNRWYLKLDIRKYFDSIDHQIVLSLLERRLKDKKLLTLFRKLLETYHTEPSKGLPIGNLISQHLANFYLGLFDHWLKETRRIKGYLRYMDDFLLFAEQRSGLQTELVAITDFLKSKLQLELKPAIQLNHCRHGIPFLGFRVFPDRLILTPQSRRRFVAKFRFYEKQWRFGCWSVENLQRHTTSLVESTKIADAIGFRNNIVNSFGISF